MGTWTATTTVRLPASISQAVRLSDIRAAYQRPRIRTPIRR
jgi:hypothetical protein